MATKDFAAIAAKKITRPQSLTRRPKYFVYGRQKKGKTTLGLSAGVDKTLVADPERGTDEFKKKNPFAWHIEKWEDLDDLYYYLKEGKHPYEWVVLDGLTKFNNMALKYVMRLQEERSLDRIPGMVQKQDYGKSGELMKDFIERFHKLPMGVIYTAQERQGESFDSEEDEDAEAAGASYIPDLPKGVRGYVNSVVDVIGRIYVVKIEGSDESEVAERRLWIGESVKYDTGYRSDFVLPDYVRRPTIPKLVSLMRTGSLPTTKVAAKKTSSK